MTATKLKRRASTEKTKAHKEFEMYVAFLYESLGFKVKKNIKLSGQEIDILAERFFPGVGRTRIAVECKWRSSASVSNQDVYNFSTVTLFLRSKQLITRGVMVSNVRYSPDALNSVHDHYEDIELLTINELENQLFDLRQVLGSYVESYERSLIFTSYVPLRATCVRSGKGWSRTSGDIEEDLKAWLQKGSAGLVSILGDFGTGKTTLLSRLKYIYSRLYLSGKSTLLPLFVPLKQFHGYQSLDEFLRSVFVSEFEREIPLTVFWRALAEGRFLVLLDGFDEMASEADADKRAENLLLLSPLITSTSRAILTCRPSYFVRDSEYEALVSSLNRSVEPIQPNFEEASRNSGSVDRSTKARLLKYKLLSHIAGYQPIDSLSEVSHSVVDIKLFDALQIDRFLAKFNHRYMALYKQDWNYIKSFLLGIYDLSDLMSRPILLTMINETILDGGLNIGSTIIDLGPTALYEIYTSMKLDLDWLKGSSRRLLTKEDRAAFAEAIAVAMYLSGTLEVQYSTLLELAESRARFPAKKDYLKNIRTSVVAADLQISTFLTRSGDETFRFSHKSFMEFFVALHLKKNVLRNLREPIFGQEVPKEILYFLGGFSIAEPSVRKKLLSWYTRKKASTNGDIYARNIAAALLYSGPHQEQLELEDTEISRIDVKKVIFDAPTWSRVKLVSTDLYNVSLNNGNFRSVTFDQSTITGLTVKRGHYEVDLSESVISKSEFDNSSITLRGVRSRVESSRFAKGNVFISGNLSMVYANFVNSYLEIGLATGITFRNCTFKHARIKFTAADYDLERCRLVDCSFDGCAILGLRVALRNCESYVAKRLTGCEGIVVIKGSGKRSAPEVFQEGKILLVHERIWADQVQRKKLLSKYRSIFTKSRLA